MPVQLNPALEFGGSLTSARVNALLVTTPAEAAEVSLLNHHGEAATVTLRPATNGWAMTLKNLPEKKYLLIYTAAVTGVKVDGRSLPEAAKTPFDSTDPSAAGWYRDPANHRIVIRLPADLIQPENIEVAIQARI